MKMSREASLLADAHGQKYLNGKVTEYADKAFAAELAGDAKTKRSAFRRMRIYEDAAAIASAREARAARSAP